MRNKILLVLSMIFLSLGLSAHAQDYPAKPVKIIVNFPAGGPLDIIARLVAIRLTATLGQPFVVENVSGAAGNIGATNVARAQPDGYTILMSIDAPFTTGPSLTAAMPFALEDFRVVTVMGVTGLSIAVHPSLGVNSFSQLIEKGRSQEITFANAGLGSPGHFAALLLADATGIKVRAIPYRGNAPAVMAVVSGEVQAGFLGTGGLLPHIKTEKIKGLAVAGSQRSILMPDLPTIAEQGYPNFTLESMFVALLPAKTPEAVLSVLHKGITEALAQNDIRERLRAMDVVPTSLTGRDAVASLTKARDNYARIVKATGMKVE